MHVPCGMHGRLNPCSGLYHNHYALICTYHGHIFSFFLFFSCPPAPRAFQSSIIFPYTEQRVGAFIYTGRILCSSIKSFLSLSLSLSVTNMLDSIENRVTSYILFYYYRNPAPEP